MSLVVAEATDDGPRIVSDTRVTFPEGPRSSFKTGTLKAIVLKRDLTICFTGDVTRGLAAVREFAKRVREGVAADDLLPQLQETTRSNGRIVEFIVADMASGGGLLTRIRKDILERNLRHAWIGDKEAFDRFQAERHRGA